MRGVADGGLPFHEDKSKGESVGVQEDREEPFSFRGSDNVGWSVRMVRLTEPNVLAWTNGEIVSQWRLGVTAWFFVCRRGLKA